MTGLLMRNRSWLLAASIGILVACSLPGSTFALTVSELMYHPVTSPADPSGGGEALEYIELYNEGSETEDLGGYAFAEGVIYTFPQGTLLPARSFLLVASDPDSLIDYYSSRGVDLSEVGIHGPWEGSLDNGGEDLELQVEGGGRLLRFRFNDGGNWPAGADGSGHSLELLSPFYDLNEPESWEISETLGGTPGSVGRFTIPTYDPTSNLPSLEWTEEAYDDSGWEPGTTPIGFDASGDYTISTQLSDMRYSYTTVYLRISFDLADPAGIQALQLDAYYDDGFSAYLNGKPLYRSSTVGGSPDVPTAYNVTCSNRSPEPSSYDHLDVTSKANLLVSGRNWLAIHAINTSLSSSDFVISAGLVGTWGGVQEVLVEPGDSWLYFKGFSEPVVDENGGEEDTRHHTAGSHNYEPIVINEFLATTTVPDEGDWIELYNRGSEPVQIGGMTLSDDADELTRFAIPGSEMLDPGSYRRFDRAELGFGLSSFGEKIFLTAADGSRVLDACNYGELILPEVSYGRFPDGGDRWHFMPSPSPESGNFVELEDSIVINEIMYHPITEDDRDEYIELYNRGLETVDLSGWRLTKAVTFDFPEGTELASGEYLVVASDAAHIQAKYGIDNAIGDYVGVLANDGERIRLRDQHNNIVEEVRYYDGGTWPKAADGDGSSLELTDPRDDNDVAVAWAASDESGKSLWTPFTHTTTHKNWWVQPESEFHLFLHHRGEALVDALSLTQSTTETLTNGSFESGTSGWKIEGTHVDSFVTTEDSVDGTLYLHIVSSGRGDTYCNRIERDASPLTLGNTYTISGSARWLKGSKWLTVRAHGQGMARAVELQVPQRLGSPGFQNGAFASNRGPSITEVKHSPVLPKPNESVTVTARVADIDGLNGVELFYGVDGSGDFSSTIMVEIGYAGSGVYSGTIPVQSNGTLMAFYIAATDSGDAMNTFPADPAYQQCLYHVVASPVLSNFPVYRILFPASTAQELSSRPRMSNHLLPCSFIYDDTEVYYLCGMRFRGSPFLRGEANPVYSKRGMRLRFAADDLLRGRSEMNLDIQDPRGGMSSLQNERVAYWICRKIGLPWSDIRYARVLANQTDHGLYGDVQKVDLDYLSYWFPGDDDGYLYKIDDWFEFNDGGGFNNRDADLRYWEPSEVHSWGEEKELYRWNYRPRSRDNEDNLQPIVTLISRMDPRLRSSDIDYRDAVESVLDVQEVLREMAVRHVVGDWDSWGYNRGKNNLLYRRPSDGRFVLIPWDIDFVLGSGDGASTSLTTTSLYGFSRLFSVFGEEYENSLWEIADGPLTPGAADGYMDRTYLLLSQEGLGVQSPGSVKSYLNARRSFIIQGFDRPVAITTNDGQALVTINPELVIKGTAPYNARSMTLNGVPIEPEWTTSTSWSLSGILSPGVNNLTIEVFDQNSISLGIASITITVNPFRISMLVLGPDSAFIAWNSTPGETYSLLAGDTPTVTTVLARDLRAQGGSYFFFDRGIASLRRRFYQVKIGDPSVLPGLKGEYFSGMNFETFVLERIDESVDFNWETGSPAPGLPEDGFSVRWTGYIVVENAGLHTFWTNSDEGVRLSIADETIIDNWTDHGPTWDSGSLSLPAGNHALLLEFHENTGSALMELEYQGPGIPRQTIPLGALMYEP